jgi:uncharacterized protein (DUF1697 family)
MIRYIAFLRGINVSGQKIIKMETLRQIITDAGFDNVKTYIQSGNLVFNSKQTDAGKLISQLEDLIEKTFGFRTEVILRKLIDIETIVKYSQNFPMQSDDEKKYYITFLKNEYPEKLEIPVFSKNEDTEIFHQDGNNLFTVNTLYKGNYGFPNAFIEKLTGIPATTRNPVTLAKILEL